MTDMRMGLTRRRILAAGGAAALSAANSAWSVAAGSTRSATSSQSRGRPNLIFYFPDELRADALGSYGNPVCQTPNMDKLAQEGTRFTNCHVQFPVCVQSRCSMLTGWPTAVHGHRSLQYLLQPDQPNMFRYLKEAGYDVYWFGKNHALTQDSFQDSVTLWRQSPRRISPNSLPSSIGPAGSTTMLYPAMGTDRRATSDHDLIQYAASIINQKERDRPFCIFLATFQPHPPYTVPADFWSMYHPDNIDDLIPPELEGRPSYHELIRKSYGLNKLTERDLRTIRAVYYGQVSYADWLLGELMEQVEKAGRNTDTALFMSSDHGDYAGDYGLVEKWPSGLEDCLTHVPMIGRIPGGQSGIVTTGMTELFDIMPTLLDLAGTRATHTHFARSLLPSMRGEAEQGRRAAFSEAGYNSYEPQAFEPVVQGLYGPKGELEASVPQSVSRCSSVRTTRYKLIERPQGVSELYDCINDPDMRENLYQNSSYIDVRTDLKDRLLRRYIDVSGVPPLQKDNNELPPYYETPVLGQGLTEDAILDL